MSRTIFKNYISTEGEERIKSYVYKCQCDSIVYKYIMSPLASLNVQILPKNLAPNTITMIAFIFNIIPHLLIIAYTGESLSASFPSWLMFLTAICQFLYMHFDNMDGKQARRTGSSSSLGMLYDHGLDSVSSWIISLNLASTVKLGNGLFAYYVLALVPLVGFYFTMWEEYNLRILKFGMVNPVDEGLTFINLLLIFTGLVGSDFWTEEAFFGLQRNHIIGLMTGLGCLGAIVTNIIHVCRKPEGKKRDSLDTLKVSLFLIFSLTIIAMFSPSNIAQRRIRSLITCFGFGFCKVIGHIQLAHCAGDKFYQWRRSFIATSTALIVNTLISAFLGKALISEDFMLNTAIVLNILFYVHYMLSITRQLTKVLGIKAFSVVPLKKE